MWNIKIESYLSIQLHVHRPPLVEIHPEWDQTKSIRSRFIKDTMKPINDLATE